MPNGYVYVLFNPALKDQVKIGKTTNSPEERAAELSTTGLPHSFVVAYAERVSDCDRVERLVHDKLGEYRVNPNREFFRVSVRDAIQAVLEIAGPFRADGSSETYRHNYYNGPDPNDTSDQQTQAGLRAEKRLRRIALKRELKAKAQAQGRK